MMRSFLGLINYLNQFSPRLAELSNPLREICRQKVEFKLTEAYKIAFQCCKEEISRNITLPYFNAEGSDQSTNRCLQDRIRSSTTTEFYPSNVCIQSIDWE